MYKNMDRKQDVGHFFCLLNIAAFLDPDEFRARIDGMIDRIKASAKRPGVDEILVPGERSARNALVNEAQGIAVSNETLAELEHWCARCHVPLDCVEVNA